MGDKFRGKKTIFFWGLKSCHTTLNGTINHCIWRGLEHTYCTYEIELNCEQSREKLHTTDSQCIVNFTVRKKKNEIAVECEHAMESNGLKSVCKQSSSDQFSACGFFLHIFLFPSSHPLLYLSLYVYFYLFIGQVFSCHFVAYSRIQSHYINRKKNGTKLNIACHSNQFVHISNTVVRQNSSLRRFLFQSICVLVPVSVLFYSLLSMQTFIFSPCLILSIEFTQIHSYIKYRILLFRFVCLH